MLPCSAGEGLCRACACIKPVMEKQGAARVAERAVASKVLKTNWILDDWHVLATHMLDCEGPAKGRLADVPSRRITQAPWPPLQPLLCCMLTRVCRLHATLLMACGSLLGTSSMMGGSAPCARQCLTVPYLLVCLPNAGCEGTLTESYALVMCQWLSVHAE